MAEASLEIELLCQSRDFDSFIPQFAGELLHHLLFAMNKERRLTSANSPVPREQLSLIRVGGKSIDRVDRTADRDLLTEEPDKLGSVDDLPCKRAGSGKPDEDDRRFLSP